MKVLDCKTQLSFLSYSNNKRFKDVSYWKSFNIMPVDNKMDEVITLCFRIDKGDVVYLYKEMWLSSDGIGNSSLLYKLEGK